MGKKPKRRVMSYLKIAELSGVDSPAQEGARALVMKRSDGAKVRKGGGVITSAEDGHTHIVYLWELSEGAGTTSHGGGTPEAMHSHPFTVDAEGNLKIGENLGHTHEVDQADVTRALMRQMQMSKSEPEPGKADTMTTKTATDITPEARITELEAKTVELEKRAQAAEAVAKLSPEARKFHDELPEADRAAFALLGQPEQAAAIKRAEASRSVVYKALDGTEYTEKDDPRLVRLSKQADERELELRAEKSARERETYAKRAGLELSNYPGEVETTKSALLKSVDTIKDEAVRKSVLEMLKAGDKALSGVFKSSGTSAGALDGEDDPEGELDRMADKIEKEQKVTKAEAYRLAVTSPEGRALYAQSVAGE